jgi:hypothetical protein
MTTPTTVQSARTARSLHTMPVPWTDGSYAWCRPSARCSTGKTLATSWSQSGRSRLAMATARSTDRDDDDPFAYVRHAMKRPPAHGSREIPTAQISPHGRSRIAATIARRPPELSSRGKTAHSRPIRRRRACATDLARPPLPAGQDAKCRRPEARAVRDEIRMQPVARLWRPGVVMIGWVP